MFRFVARLLCAMIMVTAAARAGAAQQEARTCVARLDGDPVYHWRAFTSILPDDADRALVLREFRRRGFTLPPKLVDEAIRREVAEHHQGDTKRFAAALQRKGATVEDYRQFTAEEITISAMLYHNPQQAPHPTQAEWLASLRRGVWVERSNTHQEEN